MLYEVDVAVDDYKFREKRVERDAERAWRFREFKSRERVFLSSLLTSILGLFLR